MIRKIYKGQSLLNNRELLTNSYFNPPKNTIKMSHEKKTKKFQLFAIMSLLFLSLSLVSAYNYVDSSNDYDTSSYPQDNWFGRILSGIKFSIFESGTFTVYGDELGCDKYPADILEWKNSIITGKSKTIVLDEGDAMFINIFRGSPYDGQYSEHPGDSRQFLEEVYLEYGKTQDNKYTITCDAGAYWDNDCYVENYNCPLPCYKDADCSSNQYCEKTVLSQKIPDAGVCRTSTYSGGGGDDSSQDDGSSDSSSGDSSNDGTSGGNPTHQTQVYRCSNGEKIDLGKVVYGSSNFCTDSSDTKYLIGDTDKCLPYEPEACYLEGSEGYTGAEKSESITWSEYYSNKDSFLISQGVICLQDSDCKDYDSEHTVSCIKDEGIKERIWDAHKEQCSSFTSDISGHGILGKLSLGIVNILVEPCAYYADIVTFINNAYSRQNPGVCIAESDSGVGKIWDKVLRVVGQMGLPEQYGVIISIILIITLLLVLVNFIK